MPAPAPLSANVKGVLFMALAMAGFSMNDALVKSVTGEMGTAQIMFLRGLMTSILVVVLAWHFGALRPGRVALTPVLGLRILAEVGASLTLSRRSARSRSPMPPPSCRPCRSPSRWALPSFSASPSAGGAGWRSSSASSAC